MSSTKDKTTIILCDLSYDTNKADIESFLSKYKDKITSIQFTEKKSYKAIVTFKDYSTANDCRINMNQKKLKSKAIRIMWEEKDFLQKNKDNKNNLYVKNIPKIKTHREIFEYFYKFGDVFSVKVNEDEKGNINGTAFVTYYNPEDAKKAIEETNGKKIWGSDMDVQYQKSSSEKNNDNNLKINISKLPDNYTDEDITKLCEEFGKIHIININKGQKGKYAIVKFNNEQEVKNAKGKLHNKEIGNKKIYVKDVKDNHYNYHYNNYNYNNEHNNYQQHFLLAPPPMLRYEPMENNNLYIRNIPFIVTEEELKETFGKFGKITSIKLEKESESKDDKTKKVNNKGYGYISFENVEEAKKALESLNGAHIKGTESWPKPLMIDYFVPREKRQNNFYGIQPNSMPFPQQGIPSQFGPGYQTMMIQMPIPGQYMWNQGNYRNNGYNNNYIPRYNNNGYPHRGKRGQRGGGYHHYNYQKRANKNGNSGNTANQNINQENKKNFDYESFNKLSSNEEKRDFLGEKLYQAIQENLNNIGKGDNPDIVGKITGMIMELNEESIIEILEKPSVLDYRVQEALTLLNKNHQ